MNGREILRMTGGVHGLDYLKSGQRAAHVTNTIRAWRLATVPVLPRRGTVHVVVEAVERYGANALREPFQFAELIFRTRSVTNRITVIVCFIDFHLFGLDCITDVAAAPPCDEPHPIEAVEPSIRFVTLVTFTPFRRARAISSAIMSVIESSEMESFTSLAQPSQSHVVPAKESNNWQGLNTPDGGT